MRFLAIFRTKLRHGYLIWGKKYIIAVSVLPVCCVLALLLLLAGPGRNRAAASAEAAAVQTMPPFLAEESLAESEPTAEERLLALAAPGTPGLQEVSDDAALLAMLEEAWRWPADSDSKAGVEAAGELVCSQNEHIYVLRNNLLSVYAAGHGSLQLVGGVELGSSWRETVSDGVWTAWEKIPVSVYAWDDRIAVISDYYTYEGVWEADGSWQLADGSCSELDIFDISEPASPRRLESFVQDGYYRQTVLSNGLLCLVTQKTLYPEDCADGLSDAFMPAILGGEERDEACSVSVYAARNGCGAAYTLMGLYDLAEGECLDAAALFGAGDNLYTGGNALCLLDSYTKTSELEPWNDNGHWVMDGLESACTDIYRCSFDADALALDAASVEGALLSAEYDGEKLRLLCSRDRQFYTVRGGTREEREHVSGTLQYELDADLTAETCREMAGDTVSTLGFAGAYAWFSRTGEANELTVWGDSMNTTQTGDVSVWLAQWEDGAFLALAETPDAAGMNLNLYENGKNGALELRDSYYLGSDFMVAEEEVTAIHADSRHGLIGIPSKRGYTLLRYSDEEGFAYGISLQTADFSGHVRLLTMGNYIYVADSREIHVLRASDLAFLGEWYL